ncbi:MAG TPA: MucR family transcriptional regulator [Geobacteraceae bacterium]
MPTLVELASSIVSSHAATTPMTTDELLQEIQKVHSALQGLEAGKEAPAPGEAKPALTVKQAFKANEVICMVCGKGKMKTLTRHLKLAHGMKPGEYRKQFGISSSQPLSAKALTEARRKMAQERGLADNLAKAREVRAAKLKAKKGPVEKAAPAKPAPKVEKATPAKPVKAKAAPKVGKAAPAKPAKAASKVKKAAPAKPAKAKATPETKE